MRKDICCIGHITLDKIITPKLEKYMPGGTSYYFTEGLLHLGKISYQLVTAVGKTELHVIEEFRQKSVDVKNIQSERSVFFENKYGEKAFIISVDMLNQFCSMGIAIASRLEHGIFLGFVTTENQ